MAVKITSLRADLAAEAKGSWQQAVEVIPDPDVQFHVSSIHLPAYTAARSTLMQRLQMKYKTDPIPENEFLREIGTLMAEHLLHDWKGFDVAYGKDVALELLSDPANRELIKAVELCAAKAGRISIEFVEKEAKNSGKPSATA